MKSAFEELTNEWDGAWWRTTPLKSVQHRWDALTAVAGVIARHYVPDDWAFRVNEGSVTFQSREPEHEHEVVTVFVDAGNALAQEERLQLHPDPIVVAAELSALPPLQRRCIRDYFRAAFGNLYLDPAARRSKRFLQPRDKGHFFDILFLGEGGCALDVEQVVLDRIADLIGKSRDAQAEAVVGELIETPSKPMHARRKVIDEEGDEASTPAAPLAPRRPSLTQKSGEEVTGGLFQE